MLQNATPLRKSAPWPPNISDEHVSCTAPATENASFQILFKCPTPAIVLGNATKNLTFYSLSARYRIPCACHAKPHLNVQKWTVRPSVFNAVDFEMCFAPQRALFRHLNFQKCSEAEVLCTCWLRNVLRATTACTFWASQLPKLLWTRCALYILTSKCASRHNSVHFLSISTSKTALNAVCFVHFDFEMCFAPWRRALFQHVNFQKMLRARQFLTRLISKCASRHNGMRSFDISTSKSGPTLVCFAHSDFQMCFAPQWGAIFRHLNLQKRSDVGVLCTFWLRNVLGATTSCNCSSFIWPDGSAPAALASLFDPPEPQIIGKTQCFATFLPFGAPASSFLWLFLFSDLLSSSLLFSSLPWLCPSAFDLSILSEVRLLNFLRLRLFEVVELCKLQKFGLE